MENNFEYNLFHEELKKLQNEYRRCKDTRIKTEISKDIQLLETALEKI